VKGIVVVETVNQSIRGGTGRCRANENRYTSLLGI
jgi:hypothetical protein